jgi:hypothetical protein
VRFDLGIFDEAHRTAGHHRTANQHRKFLPYTKARRIVHRLSLNGYHEWALYRAGRLKGKGPRPSFIPSDPYGYYKRKGAWVSWPDWLGTSKTRSGKRGRRKH